MDVVGFKALFYTQEKLEMLQRKFKLISPFLVQGVNQAISAGVELPIPINFKDKFSI